MSENLFDTYPVLIYPCKIYDHGHHRGQLRPPREDQMTPGEKRSNLKCGSNNILKAKHRRVADKAIDPGWSGDYCTSVSFALTPKMSLPNSGTSWGMFNDLGVYGVPRKVRNKERYFGHFRIQ